MENKLVSIIVPVYNVEDYLPSFLRSLQSQTYKDIEIIFVDDGSTDNSNSILQKFCFSNRNAKLFTQKNSGPSAARNFGYANCNGQLICFCDSDDLLHPQMIEALVNSISNTDSDMSCCSFIKSSREPIFSIKKNFKIKTINGSDESAMFFTKHFSYSWMLWNKMLKREILEQLIKAGDIFNSKIRYGEDLQLFLKYMLLIKKCSIVKAPLYFYRKRETSAVNTIFSQAKLSLINNDDSLRQYLEQFPKTKYMFYQHLAREYRGWTKQMIKINWLHSDVQNAFDLYNFYYSKSFKNSVVPLYRKIDLISQNISFKNKAIKYIKNKK